MSRWQGLLDRRREMAEYYRWELKQHPEQRKDYGGNDAVREMGALAYTFTPYWVSSDIARICSAAHPSLTLTRPDQVPIPSPSGYMEFEEPLQVALPTDAVALSARPNYMPPPYVNGVSWWQGADRKALAINGLVTAQAVADAGDWPNTQDAREFLAWMPTFLIATNSVFKADSQDYDPYPNLSRAMAALFLLMQQRITSTRSVPAERAERRREARKTEKDVPEVKIVHLRRTIAEALPQRSDGGGVDWTHRWLVSGHWRNQWFPSSQDHGWRYINPYVKGPEDKPFVSKEILVSVDR